MPSIAQSSDGVWGQGTPIAASWTYHRPPALPTANMGSVPTTDSHSLSTVETYFWEAGATLGAAFLSTLASRKDQKNGSGRDECHKDARETENLSRSPGRGSPRGHQQPGPPGSEALAISQHSDLPFPRRHVSHTTCQASLIRSLCPYPS